MVIEITDAALADVEYVPRQQTSCSCHSIREGANGLSYSYAILGVSCPECESHAADCESRDWWNSLSRDERIAELVRMHHAAAALAAAADRVESPF